MQEIISWITENKDIAGIMLIVLAILLPPVFNKIKGKLPNPLEWLKKKDFDFDILSEEKDQVSETERKDFEAIVYLRNRAIQLDNSELVENVKEIHTKFFNAHCDNASHDVL